MKDEYVEVKPSIKILSKYIFICLAARSLLVKFNCGPRRQYA